MGPHGSFWLAYSGIFPSPFASFSWLSLSRPWRSKWHRNNDVKTHTHRIHVRYIYGNIYHQYTPMLAYIPYMDPMGYNRNSTIIMVHFPRWTRYTVTHWLKLLDTIVSRNGCGYRSTATRFVEPFPVWFIVKLRIIPVTNHQWNNGVSSTLKFTFYNLHTLNNRVISNTIGISCNSHQYMASFLLRPGGDLRMGSSLITLW